MPLLADLGPLLRIAEGGPDAGRENGHAARFCGSSWRVMSRSIEIARRVGVAASTVREKLKRLQAAGLAWPLPATQCR